MVLFRITTRKWMRSAFDGEGARLVGGRWSSPGHPAVYTASSTSLAILETLVHYDTTSMPRLVVFRVEVPDDMPKTTINESELLDGWRTVPGPKELAALGDEWLIAGDTALLAVPSALVPMEQNVIINPTHPDFAKLSIAKPFDLPLDKRLFSSA
ncbi:MAG: RES family NAD+ phosphorylase [Gammaproteobacteria bacterium]